jgi:chromosome partitioning protein
LRELDHSGGDESLVGPLRRVNGQYDFVVLDCPPNLGLLTREALRVSELIIITVEPSFFALKGVANLLEIIDEIEFSRRPLVFALLTMFDRRTKFAREIFADTNSFFKERLLNTVINRNVRLQEATSYGLPITEYNRHCRGYHDYMSLAKEVSSLFRRMR